MRNTTINSKVNVIVDGKVRKGTIVEAISQGAARIEFGDKSHIQASHSLSGEDGTFHYPDQEEAVKEAKALAKAEPTEKPGKSGSGARG